MSKRARQSRRRSGSGTRSAWVYIAPAALLTAVTAIMLILSGTGVLGHTADGGPPSAPAAGPVQTLSVPQTTPPAVATEPKPTPLPATTPKPTTGKTTTAKATTTTSPSTTTTADTTTSPDTTTTPDTTTAPDTTTTPTTGDGGQHVKWTVKNGDTLSSIATQFETSVKALERLNPNVDPAALQVGQELVVR
ncbi:MAG TPA: LysM domain-containing protein [Gaiellales bacterium]|jgi:LysM repeat protein